MVGFLCGADCNIVGLSPEQIQNSNSNSTSSGSTKKTKPHKPHKAHDEAWAAMRIASSRAQGELGLRDFRILRKLGSGDIGNVFLCQLRGSGGHYYAMKVVNKDALRRRNKLHRAHAEAEILGLLDHPFLPTLYAQFDAGHYSCIVMDYCPGGDLHSLRHRQPGRRFSLRSARFYAAEVLLALEYLHMMGVIYRDLKPENVLVRQDGHIMLSDFDLSLKCGGVVPTLTNAWQKAQENLDCPGTNHDQQQQQHMQEEEDTDNKTQSSGCFAGLLLLCGRNGKQNRRRNTSRGSARAAVQPVELELVAEPREVRSRSLVGTHEYVAPEVTSGEGHGSAVDWWALGVFLHELLFGATPFRGATNEATLLNIVSQPLRMPPAPAVPAWDAARDLIRRLLVKDPATRLGSRCGAADIKAHPFFAGVNWPLLRSTAPPDVILRVRARHAPAVSCAQATLCRPPRYFDYF